MVVRGAVHAGDKVALFKELVRCLKPGGVFVFSDIMGADGADEKALKGFTDRNATTFMGRPSMYIDFIKESGFKYVTWWDGSTTSSDFLNMLSQIAENKMSEGHLRPVPGQLGQLAHRARGHPEGKGRLLLGGVCRQETRRGRAVSDEARYQGFPPRRGDVRRARARFRGLRGANERETERFGIPPSR